jgi:hypothetical protein
MHRLLFASVFFITASFGVAQMQDQTAAQGSQSPSAQSSQRSGSQASGVGNEQTSPSSQSTMRGNSTDQGAGSRTAPGSSGASMQGEGSASSGMQGSTTTTPGQNNAQGQYGQRSDQTADSQTGSVPADEAPTSDQPRQSSVPWIWIGLGVIAVVVIASIAMSGRRSDVNVNRVEQMDRRDDREHYDDIRRAG